MLIKGITSGKKNHLIWTKIPILVSGEMSSTTVSPCNKIYQNLNFHNKIIGITDSNLLIGYVWADSKRATASAIVNCTDILIGKKIVKKIAQSYWLNRSKLIYDMKSYKLNKIFTIIKVWLSKFSSLCIAWSSMGARLSSKSNKCRCN